MKTGTIAKRFGLDPNTITDWTERFPEFFTSEGRSENRKQRDYQPEDIVILNTIRGMRARNASWDEIRGRLSAGERDATLPPDFVSIEGENALTVYAEMREMRAKLETYEDEIERLRQVAEDERKRAEEQIQAGQQRVDEQIQAGLRRADEQIQAMRKQADEQMRLEREANQNKIEQLIVEKTEWRMRYEALKKQFEVSDDE